MRKQFQPLIENIDNLADKYEGVFITPNQGYELKRRFTLDEAREFLGCENFEITHCAVFNPYGIFENKMPPCFHVTVLSDPLMREKHVFNWCTNTPKSMYAPDGMGMTATAAICGKCVVVGHVSKYFLSNTRCVQEIVDVCDILDRDVAESGGFSGLGNVIPLYRAENLDDSLDYMHTFSSKEEAYYFWHH